MRRKSINRKENKENKENKEYIIHFKHIHIEKEEKKRESFNLMSENERIEEVLE